METHCKHFPIVSINIIRVLIRFTNKLTVIAKDIKNYKSQNNSYHNKNEYTR